MFKDATLNLPMEYHDIIDASLRIINPSWEYAVRAEMKDIPPKYLKFYHTGNNYVRVPRQFCLESIDTTLIEDRTLWNNPSPFKFLGSLFEPQKKALDLIDSHAGNVIIEMPTGSGKTIVGLAAAALFGRKTLILTHKIVLSDQWKARFKEFTNAKVTQIKNKEDAKNVKDVGIILAQTIRTQQKNFAEIGLFDMFDVVIIDECHRFSATTFHNAISQFPGRVRIGLTATAFRNDGLEMVFKYAIGGIKKVHAKIHKMPIIIVRQTAYDKNLPQKASYSVAISSMGKDLARNRLIVKDLGRCLENGRTILVLTDRLHQARFIFSKATEEYKNHKICLFTGSDEQNMSQHDANIIIATYGVAKEGVDIPDLDTLFYATPISDRISVTQSIGRLLRGQPEKELLVFDYVDKSNLGKALYYKRLQIYEEINIVDIRKKSGDI